ncbi:glycosyltransferase family 2 protein [Alsobacter soli]|uniref:glycosyltransferase family 2 protein n=1 Tax=Alsobacter soli TaxID=2109933 RepID=UPI001FE0FACC|nr:glycosyltransferase [Alsobacter soli]
MVRVTIGIKALNEERRIADAISSALRALEPFDGEVILADSGSRDRTVEIARAMPVRIVQLADQSQRCCGAGAQLAFQQARGDYFYLLDGDMVLNPAFLPAAVDFLERNPEFAGVAGAVREVHTDNAEFQIRAQAVAGGEGWRAGLVDRLDCGGLYRVSAIREVGYFADRNLHAFEEFDLGARLQARGWKLARLDAPGVDHYGHQQSGYRLLWARLRSGYAGAAGEVLRAALGREHLGIVLRRLSHVRNAVAVAAWWIVLAALALNPWMTPGSRLLALLALLAAPMAFLAWRRRSLRLGLYSLASWNIGAFAFFQGLFRRRAPPEQPLSLITITPSD